MQRQREDRQENEDTFSMLLKKSRREPPSTGKKEEVYCAEQVLFPAVFRGTGHTYI